MRPQTADTVLPIDLMFLDRETCGRCGGTEEALDAAVAASQPALAVLGIRPDVNKIHVTSLAQAEKLGFLTSPTIHIAGRDIQQDMHESVCGDCTDLGQSGSSVNCRHWSWRGETHTAAPVGLLVEAILRAALGAPEEAAAKPADRDRMAEMRANLTGFFGAADAPATAKNGGCGCGCG